MTVRSSFTGVDRPGCGDNHPPPSSTEVANGLELYFRLPSVPAQAYHGAAFTFTPSDARQTPSVRNWSWSGIIIWLCVNSKTLTDPNFTTLSSMIMLSQYAHGQSQKCWTRNCPEALQGGYFRKGKIFKKKFCSLSVINGSLSSRHDAFLCCGCMRRPPHVEGSCECIEYAVSDSQQGMVLELWGWARC